MKRITALIIAALGLTLATGDRSYAGSNYMLDGLNAYKSMTEEGRQDRQNRRNAESQILDNELRQRAEKREQERHELEMRLMQQQINEVSTRKETDNLKEWKAFTAANPLFTDESSKYRKYGDYLFDTEYKRKVAAGETSYSQALENIAYETYKVLGGPLQIAPEVGPPVIPED